MQITDTIADLLTRIRNANSAKHDTLRSQSVRFFLTRVISRISQL